MGKLIAIVLGFFILLIPISLVVSTSDTTDQKSMLLLNKNGTHRSLSLPDGEYFVKIMDIDLSHSINNPEDYIYGVVYADADVTHQPISGNIDPNSKNKYEIYTFLNSAYWNQKEVAITLTNGYITGARTTLHTRR
jgi:hypothetical protein